MQLLPPSVTLCSEIRYSRSAENIVVLFVNSQFHNYWHSGTYTLLKGVNEFLLVILHTPWPILLQFSTQYGHMMPFCSLQFCVNRCSGKYLVKGLNETLPYFVHLCFSWKNLGTEGVLKQPAIGCGVRYKRPGESVALLSELFTFIVQFYENQHSSSAWCCCASVTVKDCGTRKAGCALSQLHGVTVRQ